MVEKTQKSKKGDVFKSVDESPVGTVLDAVDVGAKIASAYVDQRYKITKTVDDIKDKTERKVGEIKQEAVESAYKVKRGFIQTIVESILLATGILSLIGGIIILLSKQVPIEYVLIAYGLLVTLIVLYQSKMRP